MTKSEKIFFDRAKKSLEDLIQWSVSPNLTNTINECIDILIDAKVEIEIKESIKEHESDKYIESYE